MSKSNSKILLALISTGTASSVANAVAIPAMLIVINSPTTINATIVPNTEAKKLLKKFIVSTFYLLYFIRRHF